MKKSMKYKGYLGSVEVSFEDDCLHGKVLFINDSIIYEGSTPSELEQQFKAAVSDYIAFCKEVEKDPQKPFSGSFNVRVSATVHEQAAKESYLLGLSLNEFVKTAIEEKIQATLPPAPISHFHITLSGQETITNLPGEETIWHTSQISH